MHKVICPYCKKQFDRDKIPFAQVGQRRYAHIECAEEAQSKKSQEEKDKDELEKYIKVLFQEDTVNTKITRQIKNFVTKEGYTYKGILRALSYFYGVKNNDISLANGGIGIVPYVYQEAHDYYYSIWLAQQKNVNKNINEYKNDKVWEVTITPPKRQPRRPKIFTFLDEDDI